MRTWAGLALLLLAACASTEMRRYVGQDVSELFIAYGQPENVFDLPDGRRAYQFRWGGGAVPVPGNSTTTISTTGTTARVSTVGTPAAIIESEGCLMTYIAAPSGSSWRVVETRPPRAAVC